MRLLKKGIFIAIIAAGGWWAWENQPLLVETIDQYVNNGDILTLEARFTPEQIMNANRRQLLADNKHAFREPSLKFHPYLLMESKYTGYDGRTREGTMLWSLVDGEMVIDTDSWERTHGFQDALEVGATRNDFKIINGIARHGAITREELSKDLHVDQDTLEPWIESTKQKHLVVQKGNKLQLHLQNPKILVAPQTEIRHWLVTKPYSHMQRLNKKYSSRQIEKVAKAAFGTDFTVRNMKEISLPVYLIEVENPDGSIHTTYWNALNGQQVTAQPLAYNRR
ncbi:MAG: hypothetical protein H7A37_05660 [Chlamydiales bacterium]|nr:hypothetical protein [Chlamydiia bacterium]MCP5507767.1 hypothetical protein [Chlamydiales bacterium]